MEKVEHAQASAVVDARPDGITEKQDKIIQYVAEYVVNSCNSAQYQSKLRAQTRHNAYFNFLDHSHSYHAYYEYLLQSYRYWKDMETAAQATGGAVGLYSSGTYRDEGYEYYQQQMQQEQQLQQQQQEIYNSSASPYHHYEDQYHYDAQSQVNHQSYHLLPTDAHSHYTAHQLQSERDAGTSSFGANAGTNHVNVVHSNRYDASPQTSTAVFGEGYNYGHDALRYDTTAVDADHLSQPPQLYREEDEEEPEYEIVYENGTQRLVTKQQR